MNENSQKNETIEEVEILEELKEQEEVVEVEPEIKKSNKYIQAQTLVEEAEEIIKGCDEQSESCKLLLESDLKAYEDAQVSLNNNGLEDCVLLLEKLGYADFSTYRSDEEQNLVFETAEEVLPFETKSIKSGRFTGVIYSFISMIAMLIALVYLATEKLGVTLDITRIPSVQMSSDIVSWFSIGLGFEKSLYIGSTIVIFASLFVAVLTYMIRVHLRSTNNLDFAQKQLEEAQVYQTAQGLCKWEMGRVEGHMKETLNTLNLYGVILREQKNKLERVLYIEGEKTQESEYHTKSLKEIHDTKSLIEMVQDFISLPMSQEGKLSEKSVIYLEQSKITINKVITRFYG